MPWCLCPFPAARSSQEVPGSSRSRGGRYPSPGLCWQRDTELIPAPFNIQVSLKRRHLLPPAGTVTPEKGGKGSDLYMSQLLKQTGHTHTRTHTIECNRTQCKNQFHAHAIRLCKAHTLQYSRRRGRQGGRRWPRYCTGVNVNNKESSKRALRETKRTVALYKNALKNNTFLLNPLHQRGLSAAEHPGGVAPLRCSAGHTKLLWGGHQNQE